MADATQVKRRRGTAAQCDSMVPAEAEVIVDLTNDTLRVGDGVRNGGFIMPNFNQVQTQQFVYAVAGGTGNAITVDLSPALIGYVGGTSIEFRASNNNTGAATINVNGLGAKNIKKLSGGVLTDLASGDIVSGIVYRVTYDGTQFQVTNAEFTPPAPVGGLIKLVTHTITTGSSTLTIPSGYSSYRMDVVKSSSGFLQVINGAGSDTILSTSATNAWFDILLGLNSNNYFGRVVGSADSISLSLSSSSSILFSATSGATGTAILYGLN